MLRFYWSVGRDIVARDAENKYGSGFYKNLSQDLKDALPDSDGFSPVNLFYMRRFYDLYSATIPNLPQVVEDSAHANLPQLAENSESEMCQQLVGDFIFLVPWGHHCTIIDTYFEDGNLDAAIFYLKKTVEDGWSRNVLKTFIDSGLHLRQGKAQSSFSRLLPAPNSDLAQEITRDTYIFDFTEMTEPYKERELKKALL